MNLPGSSSSGSVAEPAAPLPARSLFKKMLQDSSLYSIALIGQRMASFILVPIVTRYLLPSDYGVLDLMEQVGVVTSVILGLNYTRALGFFYFEKNANKSTVVGTTLLGALLVGGVAGVIGWIMAGPLSESVFHSAEYVPYLRLIFATLPLAFLLEAGMSWLRAEDRVRLYTGTALLRTLLGILATITLVAGFKYKIGGVLGANVFAGLVTACVIGATGVYFHRVRFDSTLFVRMLRFAVPLTLSSMAMFIIHFGDRFILPSYRGFQELGLYAVAYKIGMLLTPLQASFESYWGSQVYQIVKREDAGQIFARTFTYFMLAMSFTALALLVMAKPVLRLLAAPSYIGAAPLIPIILLAYYIRALSDFFRFAWLANGLPSHDAVGNWITAAIAAIAYVVLIPRFGAFGAASATLIAFLSAGTISAVWSHRVLPYRMERARITILAAITGVLSAIHFLFAPETLVMEIVQGAFLLLMFVALLFVPGFFSPAEKGLLRSLRTRFA